MIAGGEVIWTGLYTREGRETGKGSFWQCIGTRLGLCVQQYLIKVVVWGWFWSTGSSNQAAEVKPVKALAQH